MIVSRLQGAEGDLKALLTVARHDDLSSALQAFDSCVCLCARLLLLVARVSEGVESKRSVLTCPRRMALRAFHTSAVHRFADMEDAAGGCLCWATPAPDLSEHPLWAEVAAYNEYYRTSSLRFVASPSDDYPTEVIISGGKCPRPRPPLPRLVDQGLTYSACFHVLPTLLVQRRPKLGVGLGPATATRPVAYWPPRAGRAETPRPMTRKALLTLLMFMLGSCHHPWLLRHRWFKTRRRLPPMSQLRVTRTTQQPLPA